MEIVMLCVAAGVVAVAMAWMALRTEKVVRREPIARDDVLVHLGFSAAGWMELSSREALQIASWLEMGCERSDDFGAIGGFEVPSSLKGDRYSVQLSRYESRATPLHAQLSVAHARQVAGWLRLAATPGRTLAEARRQSTRVPT